MAPDSSPVERLASVLESLPEAVKSLRADVHDAERARQRANKLNRFLLIVAAALLAVVAVVGVQIYSLAREIRATNATIADCSTVGGRCYEQGRERMASAIGDVTRISVYVSQCGRLWPGESGPEYDAKLQACVAERLRAAVAAPSVTPAPAPSLAPTR